MGSKVLRLQAALESEDGSLPVEESQPLDSMSESEFDNTDSLLNEVDRVQDVREGMVDLASVCASIESATPQNLALIQIATNLALAGTKFAASDMIPSLESSLGLTVSTEKLSDTAKALWAKIIETLKKVLASIADFWKSMITEVGRAKFSNDQLTNRAKGANGKGIKVRDVKLGIERMKLETLNKVPNTGNDVLRALKEGHRQLAIVLGQYSTNVVITGTEMVAAIGGEVNPSADYLANINKAAETLNFKELKTLLNARPYNDLRFSKDEVSAAPSLPGNKSIFVNDHGNGDVSNRYASLAKSNTAKPNSQGDNYTMDTISIPEILSISKEVDAILSLVIKFNGEQGKKLSTLSKTMLTATETAKGKIDGLIAPPEAERNYTAAARSPTAFNRWAQPLQSQLSRHMVTVCKAAMTVCEASLKNHE